MFSPGGKLFAGAAVDVRKRCYYLLLSPDGQSHVDVSGTQDMRKSQKKLWLPGVLIKKHLPQRGLL